MLNNFLFLFLTASCALAGDFQIGTPANIQPSNNIFCENLDPKTWDGYIRNSFKVKGPLSCEELNYTMGTFSDPDLATNLPIFPSRFKVIKIDPSDPTALRLLQPHIDTVNDIIVSTASGSNLCRRITDGTIKSIQDTLGVSSDEAQRLSKYCAPNPSSKFPVDTNYRRKFIVVVSPEEDWNWDSWTTRMNVTFLMIKASINTADSKQLTRSFVNGLTHELYMLADAKESWGLFGDLGPKYKGNKTCELVTAIRDPILKYTFSTLRAFKFERQVIREYAQTTLPEVLSRMGFDELPPEPTTSCAEQVKELIPYLTEIDQVTPLEPFVSQKSAELACGGNVPPLDYDEAINLLSTERVETADSGQESICDYLLKPDVGWENRSPTAGGPRPRIGGGTQSPKLYTPQLKSALASKRIVQIQKIESIRNNPQHPLSQTVQDIQSLMYKNQFISNPR